MYRYIKASSSSSNWSKTIDLHDYFEDHCFDIDGNFDGSLCEDDDWIYFNFDELKNGFGDTDSLYEAVLHKAGFSAPQDFVENILEEDRVDNDGNLEFVLYGEPSLKIPNIRFKFSMYIDGSNAKIVLTSAKAE